MRRALLLSIVFAMGCGETAALPPAEPAVAPAPQRTPRSVRAEEAAPQPETASAAVQRLVEELRDAVDPRPREAIVADLVGLGMPGFEQLLIMCGTKVPDANPWPDSLLADVATGLGTGTLDVMAAALNRGPGPHREGALAAVCEVWQSPMSWQYEPQSVGVARALTVALSDPDVAVRLSAIWALGRSGPTGVPVAASLSARLSSGDSLERGEAITALWWQGPDDSVDIRAVVSTIHATDALNGDAALQLLGRIDGRAVGSVNAVIELLRDADPGLRARTAHALTSWRSATPALLAEMLRLCDGPEAQRGEFDLAGDAASAVRDLATASPQIACAVSDALPSLSTQALCRVLDCADLDAAPALATATAKLLCSQEPRVREAALSALSGRKDGIDPAIVRPFLDDPDESVRGTAEWVLETQSHRRTSLEAIRACDPRSPSDEVLALLLGGSAEEVPRAAVERLAASDAPLGAAPEGVLDAVVGHAFGSDAQTASAVRVALRFDGGGSAIAQAAIRGLTDVNCSHESLDSAFTALAEAGSAAAEAIPAVEAFAAANPNRCGDSVRRALAALTGDPSRLGDSFDGKVESGRRLLAAGDAGALAIVRWASNVGTWYLKDFDASFVGDETLGRAVVAAVATPGDDEDAWRMRDGAVGLAPVLGPSRAIGLVVGVVHDPAARVRRRAAEVLAVLGDEGVDLSAAADALGTLLSDVDHEVRREAILAARRVPALASGVRAHLSDADARVRLQASAAVLGASAGDAEARRVFFSTLGAPGVVSDLFHADWDVVGAALGRIALTAGDAPALGDALRQIDDCGHEGTLLAALRRLGPDAAVALPVVRFTLAGGLGRLYGAPSNRPEAIAVLAAIGPAAAPALPDLRRIAVEEPELRAAALDAIERIASGAK